MRETAIVSDDQVSMHEAVGGDEFFADLVAGFYEDVAVEPLLRPMYPDDLAEPIRTLTGFLIQYWGGSQAYSEERGHPRLRMRHNPFVIGPAERDAWLRSMLRSLNRCCQEREISVDLETKMRDYFTMAAEAMQNSGNAIRQGGIQITREP